MAKEIKEQRKKMNPLLTILFAFGLPLIVASILAVLFLSLLGVDVAGWTEDKLSKTPILSSFVKTEDEKLLTDKLEKANETIQTQNELVIDLEDEVEQLEAKVDNLELEMTKLENASDLNENEITDLEEDVDIKKLASSFRKMDKVQAANIVSNLSVSTAVLLLSNISPDVRGEILENMEPQTAANLMESMME